MFRFFAIFLVIQAVLFGVEMLNQVQYRHDSVVINTDGKPVAALVDALCQRIEAGYDGVPEDEGIAEIEAASCQPRLTARHGLSSRQIFR